MRSMFRFQQSIALAGACLTMFSVFAQDAYKYGRSDPPLDKQTQIPMNRLLLGDQLQQHQIAYGELADNQKIPPDGTIELIRKKIDTRSARGSRAGEVLGYAVAPFLPLIILPVAIVALPFIAANELLKAPDAKAAAGPGDPKEKAQTQNPVDTETGMSSATEEERILSQQRHAQWLATVVTEGQWSFELDDTYISALNQALGWKAPPLKGMVNQYKQLRLGTGISKIVLLDSKRGERTLILCARVSVERAGETIRYFETCQSGNIGLAMPHDSPASSEALRAVLVEQARKLSVLQAKALTEQTEFVQVEW